MFDVKISYLETVSSRTSSEPSAVVTRTRREDCERLPTLQGQASFVAIVLDDKMLVFGAGHFLNMEVTPKDREAREEFEDTYRNPNAVARLG